MSLSVQDLVRANEPIYVLNRTGKYLPKQGTHVLVVKDQNNNPFSVQIPATKYPFLVSAYIPAKLLAESAEFYSAIAKGVLELVDPDDARAIMENPMAQQVQEQALKKFQPIVRHETAKPPELVHTKSYGPDVANQQVSAPNRAPLQVSAETRGDDLAQQGVDATVLQITMDLKSDPSLYEEKFLELAGIEGLTDLDFGYLLQHCKDFPKILQFARSELASLVEGEDAEVEAKPKGKRKARRARNKRS